MLALLKSLIKRNVKMSYLFFYCFIYEASIKYIINTLQSSLIIFANHQPTNYLIISRTILYNFFFFRSLLVIVENVVRVYNIKTGDCTRILETERPVTELKAIQFPENEDYNLFAISDTGCVTAWTWENGVVLRETVRSPLFLTAM